MPTLCKFIAVSEKEIQTRANLLLNRILHDYSRFSVGTIDSFFQRIIRSFVKETGIQAGFSLEMDDRKILEIVCDQLLVDIENNKDLRNWIFRFAEDKVESGKGWNLTSDLQNLGKEVFKEIYKLFDKELIEKIQDKNFLSSYLKALDKIISDFELALMNIGYSALTLMKNHSLDVEDFSYGKTGVAGYFLKLSEKRISPPGKRAADALNNPDVWAKKTSKKIESIKNVYHAGLNTFLEEAINYHESNHRNYITAQLILKNMYALGILTDISKKIKEYCNEQNLFLLSDAPKLLKGVISESEVPFVYEKTGYLYRHFMIDEFQDTSAMQWGNFKPLVKMSLSEGGKSLIVGDVKQSIYRWRNGDWKLLAEQLPSDIAPYATDEISLSVNWRSKKNIIGFNNTFFSAASSLLQDFLNEKIIDSLGKKITLFEDRILNAYNNAAQQFSTRNDVDGGEIKVSFIERNEEDDWKEAAKDKLSEIIESLQDNDVALKDIVILVRSKKEGKEIADKLIEIKSNAVSEKYSYDFISSEALYISNNPAIKFILHVLNYLIAPDDGINKAVIVNELLNYIHPTDSLSQACFHKYKSSDLFSFLPEKYQTALQELEQKSLFELVEDIIFKFDLNKTEEFVPYLQAFQDHVMAFVTKETSDISSFIHWWEEEGSGKTISLSEQQNAIKIMTIHKSKGLEFKAVIVPFCNWSLDHEQWTNNILWCSPTLAPFNDLSLIPVKYTSRLAETHFFMEYFSEKMQALIDNLNLLYVAFTRAESFLYILSPMPKDDKMTTAGDLLFKIISGNNSESFVTEKQNSNLHFISLKNYFDSENFIFHVQDKFMKKNIVSELPTPLLMKDYPVYSIEDRMLLRKRSNHIFDDNEGLNIFENIITANDVDKALNKKMFEAYFSKQDLPELNKKILELLNNPSVCNWFDGSMHVVTEKEILYKEGKTKRPDRIMIQNKNAIIVDYKTGKPHTSHQEQILQYVSLLKDMNFEKVNAFLWYLGDNNVIEVC